MLNKSDPSIEPLGNKENFFPRVIPFSLILETLGRITRVYNFPLNLSILFLLKKPIFSDVEKIEAYII